MARTIQSPGVEIKEVDLSLRPELPAGTTILIPGFANSGPTDEIIQITSISDFEQTYGEPTNSAERYFYHTTKASLNSTGNVNVVRLAYGSGDGANVTDTYGALMYPVFPLITDKSKLASVVDDTTLSPGATAYINDGASLSTLSASDWTSIFTSTTGDIAYKDADVFFIGEPSTIEVDSPTYRKLIENNLNWGETVNLETLSGNNAGGFTDTTGLSAGGGIMLLNKKRTAINEKFEGSYIGIIDNAGLNPGSDFSGIKNVKTVTAAAGGSNKDYKIAPSTRFTFGLTADNNGVAGSLSEVMEGLPSFNTASPEFSDTLSIGVFKLKGSTLNPDTTKLDYVFQESFTGSFNYYSKQFPVEGGNPVSFYIEGESQKSDTIKMYVNPYISKEDGDWVNAGDEDAKPRKRIRLLPSDDLPEQGDSSVSNNYFLNDSEDLELVAAAKAIKDGGYITSPQNLYPVGAFKETVALGDTVTVGNVPGKLNRIFDWADNYELYDFDIILEAGLGTVYAQASANTAGNYFDDEKYLDVSEVQTTKELSSVPQFVEDYRAVVNTLDSFCTVKRKDCIFIADGIRNLMIQGENTKVLEDESKTFSKNVYWPMRHVFQTFNTSYGAVYANWTKVNDKTLNKNIWVPFSGFAAASMANTDSNFQPWFAPAGFTRGLVSGALDLAVYPNQKHRDSLYKVGLNPVANFPNDGFVIFGQKTLQAKPSAFDRINVRRMFIYCEKAVRNVMKYFVFEPNTLATRTQVVNVLTPIFDFVKQTEGLYDYMLICDERNNTADVIDRNELVVDIYLKPVRSAEFVLVNFYATRTDQSFAEIIA